MPSQKRDSDLFLTSAPTANNRSTGTAQYEVPLHYGVRQFSSYSSIIINLSTQALPAKGFV